MKSLKRYGFATIVTLWTGVCGAQVLGAGVNLAWDPNTEPDLAGYKVYYGTASRSYSAQVVLGIQTSTSSQKFCP